MEKIIGRQIEKNTLRMLYESDSPEFAAVYGRRRVGKTFLIREFFKNQFTFYHTGLSPYDIKKKKLKEEQLKSFAFSLSRYGMEDGKIPSDWMEAFQMLIKLLENKKTSGKKVVFLDEIPWMDTMKSGFLSALEYFWNSWGSARNDLLLIVCGSATSWINNNLINNTGGLYNRLTRQIHLSPMNLNECETLLKSNGLTFSRYDIAQAYMVFGGIPYYLKMFQKGLSVAQNIDFILFRKNAELAREFDRLFSSLFINPEDYIAIVTALAETRSGMNRKEIAAIAKSDGGGLTKILTSLEENGFIETRQDISRKKKNMRYCLTDSFCLFALQFSEHIGKDDKFWQATQNQPATNAWKGFAFENLCFNHIRQIKSALGIADVHSAIGTWTFKGDGSHDGAQIDMLIYRNDRVINLCEMKFSVGEYTISKDYDRKLRSKIQSFIDVIAPKESIQVTFITTYGLKGNQYSGIVQKTLDLDDLFQEVRG